MQADDGDEGGGTGYWSITLLQTEETLSTSLAEAPWRFNSRRIAAAASLTASASVWVVALNACAVEPFLLGQSLAQWPVPPQL